MIWVVLEKIDVADLNQALQARNPGAGGFATFFGCVRADDGVAILTLEHYPGMTESILSDIETEARERWRVCDLVIYHRVGDMIPGETIVFVGAAAEHRREALEAVSYSIDQLKTRAAFWKKEQRASGNRWVEARGSDEAAASAWHRLPKE